MTKDPGEVFEAIYDAGQSGLAGNLAVAIHDDQSNVVFGPTTLNIVELIVDGGPTGSYRGMLTAPAVEEHYTIHWSNDGSFDPLAGGAVEDLDVEDTTLDLPSLGGAIAGVLCSAWTTTDAVLDCCSGEFGSDFDFDPYIAAASELLYFAEGKQHPGVCSRTVRPCVTDSCMCGVQVLSRGHLVNWDGGCWGGYQCGCRATSRVKLAGTVREVTEVKVDGVVVDPDDYFVYDKVYLTRKNGGRWPTCQSLDLDDTEAGTWSVTYTFGKPPPVSGQLAASTLACELAKACAPGVECAIPNGIVSVTRQGISFTRAPLARDENGKWATGMMEVDLFLNTVNPHGLTRSAVAWSAGSRSRYARPSPV